MKTTEQYIEILRQYKNNFAAKFGITRIGIFGSVARHEQTEASDIDVCVHLAKPDFFALVHIKDDLEHLFQKNVDIIHARPRMDEMLKRSIQQDIIYAE